METNNKRKVIYKCSSPNCSFEAFLPIDSEILCPDGPNNMKKVKMGDTCFICNEGKIIGDRFDEEFDPIQYPTLVKYQPRQIWNAVIELQGRHSDMTEEQCLLNLEMDLFEKELLTKGK